MSTISAVGLLLSTFFVRTFSMPLATDTTELITRSTGPTTFEIRAVEITQRAEEEPDWDYGKREIGAEEQPDWYYGGEAEAEEEPEWDYGKREAEAEEEPDWDYGKREAGAGVDIELTIRAPNDSVIDTSDTNLVDFSGKHQVYNDRNDGGCSVM